VKTKVLITGGDEKTIALLDALKDISTIEIIGVCDCDNKSGGMEHARKLALKTSTNPSKFMRKNDIDVIIEASGPGEFQNAFREDASENVKIIDSKTAGLILDIAREKENEVHRMKSDFISATTHELRTPLTAIKESVMLILDGSAGDTTPQQKRFLTIAKKNIDRLAGLVDNLLDISRIETRKLTIKKTSCDISALIERVLNALRPLAKEKKIQLKLALSKNLQEVQCDPDRIAQVLNGLVDNAVKFTSNGGKVIVSCRRLDMSSMQISVRDTGEGISKKDIPRLFKKFGQLNVSLTRKPGGTGLGLAISKAIVEMHGGRIWAESAPGKGSIFSFTLPVRHIKNNEEKDISY